MPTQVVLWAIVIVVIIYLLLTDQSNSPRWERWIPPLFFLSGFPALIYQIVWQRALFVVFGSNIQSVTTIVTLFILGLGIGSLLSGRISAHVKSPLTIFAFLELSIGIFGALSLPLFHLLSEHLARLSTAGTAVMVSLVLLPPTMLMGATLPILVAHISARDPVIVGRSVGKLYFVNTLGSAIVCFLCAQFAMRMFGQVRMTWVAATINVFIALFVLFKRPTGFEPVEPGEGIREKPSIHCLISIHSALVLVFFTGVIALAYELVWYRIFSFSDGGRASGFAYVLASYLGGLAYGSLIAEFKSRKAEVGGRRIGMGTVGALIIIFNILAFLVAPLLGFAVRYGDFGGIASLLLIALAAGCLGSVFPLLAGLSVSPGRTAGAGLGALYFANMLGAACGSFIVGYVIFDFLPIAKVALLLALSGLACGTVLTISTGKIKESVAVSLALAIVIVALAPILFDRLYERLLFKPLYRPGITFEHVIENRNGVIAVTKDGTVYGGGVFDGVFNTQLLNDSNNVDRCYAISSFAPTRRTVLMIGLSSGSWAQVVANDPQVEREDIVEINPGYLQLIPKYPEVASLLRNQKVTIWIDDGRRWLRRNPQRKYDLIVMNTSFHWRANITNLLSVEFLTLIKQHLNPGGVLFYNTTSSREVQLTGATVFPYAVRVSNFLAVSDSPMVLDPNRLRETLSGYKIDGKSVLDLTKEDNRIKLDEIVRKVEHPVTYGEDKEFFSFEYADSLRRRCVGARLYTDDNMGQEWPE